LGYAAKLGDRYEARVPVFTQRDNSLIREVRRIGREVLERWFVENYEPLKSELSVCTPWRYGQPFAEGFYPIWHYIFGSTNRQLVENGLFADPYAPERKFKGYIPAVFHESAMEGK
jgi:hypothetical protein